MALVIVTCMPGALCAREQPPGVGSTIVPQFSVQHEVMHPGERVELLACVMNVNPRSSHGIQPGDSFTFEFSDGDLGPCGSPSAIASADPFSIGDFACEVVDRRLTLTYVAAARSWPAGSGPCVEIPFTPGSSPVSVRTSSQGANYGAYAPPQPTALLLSISSSLGVVGPEGPRGPEGPEGPAGPPGPSIAGERHMVQSTGTVAALTCNPPVIVPGLDTTIDVGTGANLLVEVDIPLFVTDTCTPDTLGSLGRLDLVVDGAVVASRTTPYINRGFGVGDESSAAMSWLSGALAAGTHAVRVTLVATDTCVPTDPNHGTVCAGSATIDGRESRLVLVELRP